MRHVVFLKVNIRIYNFYLLCFAHVCFFEDLRLDSQEINGFVWSLFVYKEENRFSGKLILQEWIIFFES